jgi:hypothetical protein
MVSSNEPEFSSRFIYSHIADPGHLVITPKLLIPAKKSIDFREFSVVVVRTALQSHIG